MPSLQHTQAAVVALRNPNSFAHLLANVPRQIEQVLDRPTISALVNAGAKRESIEACLALEIAKVSNMITAGGNLRQGQAVEIARELIAEHPNESLEDFCLCLRRGIKGIYGDIFRFDVVVIFGWFKQYLEEKYQVLENKLMSEKDNQYEPLVPDFSVQSDTLTDEIKKQKEKERLKAWLEAIKGVDEKKIAPLTEDDIRKEGQEKPKANFHPVTTLSQAQAHELHLEWIRQNFDKYTADKLPTWKPEKEWISLLTEDEKRGIYSRAGLASEKWLKKIV